MKGNMNLEERITFFLKESTDISTTRQVWFNIAQEFGLNEVETEQLLQDMFDRKILKRALYPIRGESVPAWALTSTWLGQAQIPCEKH